VATGSVVLDDRGKVRTVPALGVVRRSVRELGLAMIVGGIVVLLFVLYQLFGTTLTEQHDQSALARAFHTAHQQGGVAPAAPPRAAGSDGSTVASGGRAASTDLSPSTPEGSAIEHLVIPRIGVNRYVVQGTAEQDLVQGPGHYVNTPFPGQKGNAAIAGHRTTYGAPFFRLNELPVGSRIYVTNTKGRTFVYAVARRLVVDPTGPGAIAVLADTKRAELTLTTCNPRFEATNRLVVVADLVGQPATAAVASPTLPATPSATPTPSRSSAPTTAAGPTAAGPTAAAADTLGQGSAGGWPPAIAWGAGFVILWVLTRLAFSRTRRGRRVGSLIVGIVACAVPLWFCFENVVRILPPSL
jgi:sortase A